MKNISPISPSPDRDFNGGLTEYETHFYPLLSDLPENWAITASWILIKKIRSEPWLSFLLYKGVSKSFRTGRLERELQIVHLSATTYSCIAISWVSLLSFAANTLCLLVIVVVYFVIESVRKLSDTSSYFYKSSWDFCCHFLLLPLKQQSRE
jgi:hypothetical protein